MPFANNDQEPLLFSKGELLAISKYPSPLPVQDTDEHEDDDEENDGSRQLLFDGNNWFYKD